MTYAFDALIEQWINEGSVPGAVLAIQVHNRFQFLKAYGSYSDNESMREVQLDTLFDLASLTKVVATLPTVLSLASDGTIQLDDPISMHIKEFPHQGVRVRHLLQHTSGLPADLPFQPRPTSDRQVMLDIMRTSLEADIGSRVKYSDLGFILLGELVKRTTGRPLDQLAKERLFEPLGMADTLFNPVNAGLRERTAATEYVDGAYIVGEVHDEKSYHLGGVSGSAGLFSTASDLLKYMQLWHNTAAGLAPAISREMLELCFDQPYQGRALGWEIRESDDPEYEYVPSSCGLTWPQGSFGHTGFTGTSIWADPKHHLTVIWLTNGVHLGRSNPVRLLRRKLHDQIRSDLIHEMEEG
ncbi:serine hydrolase domain-containing protein [Paenibacillus marinisediminis]